MNHSRREATPHDPDQEALLIAQRLLERVAVARSLVRITGRFVRAYAEAQPMAKVARAATAAAKHAARRAAERLADDELTT